MKNGIVFKLSLLSVYFAAFFKTNIILLFGVRFVFCFLLKVSCTPKHHNNILLLRCVVKRGSRGAARAAKSLRWRV